MPEPKLDRVPKQCEPKDNGEYTEAQWELLEQKYLESPQFDIDFNRWVDTHPLEPTGD